MEPSLPMMAASTTSPWGRGGGTKPAGPRVIALMTGLSVEPSPVPPGTVKMLGPERGGATSSTTTGMVRGMLLMPMILRLGSRLLALVVVACDWAGGGAAGPDGATSATMNCN